MELLRQLRLLLAIAPLISYSVAVPATQNVQTRFEDNDDTPLPLVIWHGMME
jgi:hypothetical protein